MNDFSSNIRGSLNNQNAQNAKGGKKINNDVNNAETPISDTVKEKLAKPAPASPDAPKVDLLENMKLAWIASGQNPDLNPATARISREIMYNLPSQEVVMAKKMQTRAIVAQELKELNIDVSKFLAAVAPDCDTLDEYADRMADDHLIGKVEINLPSAGQPV